MKKLALTIAIVLGISLGSFAQGGLFQYGEVSEDNYGSAWFALDQNKVNRDPLLPGLPGHEENGNQTAPLGGGALLLIGFGAAYALKKRNEK
jgi:hypothetical protein